jgi:hypothetical protein
LPNKEKLGQNSSIKNIVIDRPSHWGSKPKPKRASYPMKSTGNKKSKIENEKIRNKSGSFMPGMFASFPQTKASVDAGKMDTISFKPNWMGKTEGTKSKDNQSNLRESNVDEIQEMEVCICIYIYTYGYIYIYMDIYIYESRYIHIYVYIFMCICLYTYINMWIYTYIYINIYMNVYIFTYTYVYLCVCIYIYIHI